MIRSAIKLSNRVVLTESQLSRTCSLLVSRTPAEFQIASIQKSHKRQLSIHTSILYDKSNSIEDFRVREEKKEEEFNKSEPAAAQEDAVEEEPEDPAVVDVKLKILDAALTFVPTHGWKKEAIIKGAEQVGYPGTIAGLFPRGGIELIRHYYLKCNKELIDKMKEKVGDKQKVENPKEFVAWAIKERLLMMDPYIKQWPQALAIMTLPPNVPTSIANQLTLVDDICYYSGDRSVDFNWYARRIGLATIYKAVELYMLQDTTENYAATWTFLERRIADAGLVHDVLMQSGEATQQLSHAVTSAFTTARNILGLNFPRR